MVANFGYFRTPKIFEVFKFCKPDFAVNCRTRHKIWRNFSNWQKVRKAWWRQWLILNQFRLKIETELNWQRRKVARFRQNRQIVRHAQAPMVSPLTPVHVEPDLGANRITKRRIADSLSLHFHCLEQGLGKLK